MTDWHIGVIAAATAAILVAGVTRVATWPSAPLHPCESTTKPVGDVLFDVSVSPFTAQWNYGPLDHQFVLTFQVSETSSVPTRLVCVIALTSGADSSGFASAGIDSATVTPGERPPSLNQPISVPSQGSILYVNIYVTGPCATVQNASFRAGFIRGHLAASTVLTWDPSLNGCASPPPV
ncbi:MAG: hypothetical protein QOG53_2185 [Frankiales bacterium]|jgi:hypothetical protein|nr:hypothetical protein [Frankiales bacterium]